MGFYKDGKWQPEANEIAAGDYHYEKDYPNNDKQRIAELEAELEEIKSEENINIVVLTTELRDAEAEVERLREALEAVVDHMIPRTDNEAIAYATALEALTPEGES